MGIASLALLIGGGCLCRTEFGNQNCQPCSMSEPGSCGTAVLTAGVPFRTQGELTIRASVDGNCAQNENVLERKQFHLG